MQGIPVDPSDISSADNDFSSLPEDHFTGLLDNPFPSLTLGIAAESPGAPMSDGDMVDALLGNAREGEPASPPDGGSPSRNRVSRLRKVPDGDDTREPRDATGKPPTLDEWVSFFGRVVLKTTCDFYIDFAFRGIDEDMVNERDLDRITMTDEERKIIAVPLAELSNKSKFMRKHGRTMVASGDAIRALVVLGAWSSRVNRIAAKYRPKKPPVIKINGMSPNGNLGQDQEQAAYATGAGNGRVPNGFRVYNPGGN
jgi:hypothetical protein